MSFVKELVSTVQKRLSGLDFYTGPIDGDAGPLTESAMTDFKAANGLRARSYPGILTLTRLFSDDAKARPMPKAGTSVPLWMAEAQRLKGVREKAGSGSNPVILQWADDLDLHYPDDDIPWCGLFVAHCMRVGAAGDRRPANVLGARNWLQFGNSVAPCYGSVLVFWRGSKSGWQGHVGFYAGEDNTAFHVLGGNQSNSVNIARVSKSRLLGARWPGSVPVSTKRVLLNADGTLSTNEA